MDSSSSSSIAVGIIGDPIKKELELLPEQQWPILMVVTLLETI